MNTITPIANSTYKQYSQNQTAHEKNLLLVDSPDDFQASVSFKSKLKAKRQALGAVGIFGTLLSALGITRKKEVEPPMPIVKLEETPIEIAKRENPRLANGLLAETHYVGARDEDIEIRDYNDDTVAVIVKYNKEDPEFAYLLATTVATKGMPLSSIKIDEVEYIAQALQEKPEKVQDYSQRVKDPTQLYHLLKAHELAPELTDSLVKDKNNFSYNILEAAKLYQDFPQETPGMCAAVGTSNLGLLKKLAPIYKEEANAINSLAEIMKNRYSYIPSNFIDFLGRYKANPEVTRKVIVQDSYYLNDIPKVIDAELSAPTIFAIAEYLRGNPYSREFPTIKDSVSFATSNSDLEPQIAKLQKLNPEYSITEEPSDFKAQKLLKIIEAFQGYSNELDRIIDDGRIENAIELKSLYNRYPGVKISQEMVNLELDPIKKLFG